MRCIALCLSTDLSLSLLQARLTPQYEASRLSNILAVKVKDFGEEGHIFCFSYGVMVYWGLTAEREKQFFNDLQKCVTHPLKRIVEEEFEYQYASDIKMVHDDISLPNKEVFTKLAISFAIGQSIRLTAFESSVQNTIIETSDIPDKISRYGMLPIPRKELPKLMAQLIKTRHSVNLYLEMLDTPKFIWENPELEIYYLAVRKELEVERRLQIVNQRMQIVLELFDMLEAELKHQDSKRLEWIVITLIFIEVVVTLFKEVFKII